MKILCIIPARSGSKGIPHKNIKNFGDKPLIHWSIDQAKKSRHINRIIISTDSAEYAEMAIKYGAEAPFLRPKEISTDFSTDYEFIKHCLDWLNDDPDLIVQLRPTYPLRDPNKIDDMIEKFIANIDKYDSLRTVIEVDKTPYKMYNIKNDYLIPLFNEVNGINEPYNQCRQILPKCYLHNGYVDIFKPNIVYQGTISGRMMPYIMDKSEIDDIDTPQNWIDAEQKLMNFN